MPTMYFVGSLYGMTGSLNPEPLQGRLSEQLPNASRALLGHLSW